MVCLQHFRTMVVMTVVALAAAAKTHTRLAQARVRHPFVNELYLLGAGDMTNEVLHQRLYDMFVDKRASPEEVSFHEATAFNRLLTGITLCVQKDSVLAHIVHQPLD